MITAYCNRNNQITPTVITVDDPIPVASIWLDIYQPTEAERLWLASYSAEDVPDRNDRNEIEASSRFYLNSDGLHINALFSQRTGPTLASVNVYFNLREQLLITMRDDDEPLISSLITDIEKVQFLHSTPQQLFIHLFKMQVDHLADLIEEIYSALNNVSQEVFDKDRIDEVFKLITIKEDSNGKARLNLLDTQRVLKHMQRDYHNKLSGTEMKEISHMLSDIESLIPHSQFLFEKLNFLMDAAMGFTSLQQNKISKIFSVAAVVFLPPTLIASTYGMNFDLIPEIHWRYGYPWSLLLMLASAVATYWFFKIKRWL
ncbi:magnesium/cobalt transporter CorA [Shewanella schlegeliana]|uniref:Magnesium transport protein CorA n=1 Tax=Shewanella schlegeliana TaxID=190308 RepID=A0ABS1SZL7_9GAMM|nr:magnesium/cobalt transporter CorA [Shewanella schlegeliana]MBL4913973.1 magnesium/cobalt transporter CorA [Shewanella schlegeliana]MCL1108643.1 magnesium/cobalt transporter CorA [Shewanella schlegeliana]GIU35495.1 magnesium transport protein CorA [Shewanella schlegeliana]